MQIAIGTIIGLEKAETQPVESHGRHEIENQLRYAKEDWQKRAEQFQINISQRDHHTVKLPNKTITLIQELTDHENILRGRGKEI